MLTGRTRYSRLRLIGTSSTYLCLEALKSAVIEAKKGKDVGRYEIAVSTLAEAAPGDSYATLDTAWVERTKHAVKVETDKIELELRGYKNNLIKESIRVRSLFIKDGLSANISRIDGLPRSWPAIPEHGRPQ